MDHDKFHASSNVPHHSTDSKPLLDHSKYHLTQALKKGKFPKQMIVAKSVSINLMS